MPAPKNWYVQGTGEDSWLLTRLDTHDATGNPVRDKKIRFHVFVSVFLSSTTSTPRKLDSWVAARTSMVAKDGTLAVPRSFDIGEETLSCVGGQRFTKMLRSPSFYESDPTVWSCASSGRLQLQVAGTDADIPEVWKIVSGIRSEVRYGSCHLTRPPCRGRIYAAEVLHANLTEDAKELLSSFDNPQFDPEPLPSESQTPLPLATEPFPPAAPPAFVPKADENPIWSGWDVLLIAAITLGILFVAQLAVVFGARRLAFPHQSWVDVAQKPVLALIAELVAYAAVAIYMFLLIEVKYHSRFWPSIRWNWPGAAGISLMGIGVLMLGFDMLGRFLPMPKTTPFDQFFDSPMDAYLTAAFAITLGPLMEEIFFRGFLYPVLARRLGAFWGVVLTALPFGGMHYIQYRSWAAVLIIILVGVVLATVRAVTKSVACSFLAHVGYNGTLMILAAVATDGFKHMEKASVLVNY